MARREASSPARNSCYQQARLENNRMLFAALPLPKNRPDTLVFVAPPNAWPPAGFSNEFPNADAPPGSAASISQINNRGRAD